MVFCSCCARSLASARRRLPRSASASKRDWASASPSPALRFVRRRALRLRSASSFLSRCALLYLRSAFFHSIDRSCRCCFCTSSDASRSTTGNVLSSGRRRRSYHTSRARSPFARSSGKSLSRFGGRSSVHSTTALMSGILVLWLARSSRFVRCRTSGRRDSERRRGKSEIADL